MKKANKFKVFRNVIIGKNVVIEANCFIGKPPRGEKEGELKTNIGDNAVIRSGTVIYAGVEIGDNFQSGHNVLIREGNIIGNNVSVGTNSMLEPDNKIGDKTRIHSGCFMESVTIEECVFVGPCVVFTDDPHPPCPRYKDCLGGAVVKSGVKIGANSTILPGIAIQRGAIIGAGSVVTKDVAQNKVVAGNPARIIKSKQDLECIKKFFQKPYQWEVI